MNSREHLEALVRELVKRASELTEANLKWVIMTTRTEYGDVIPDRVQRASNQFQAAEASLLKALREF